MILNQSVPVRFDATRFHEEDPIEMTDTPPEKGPHARRQRLAAELRRSRELAGMPGRELGQRIGVSQSRISRVESGAALPSLPEVNAWAQAVEASPQTRELLQALTEAAFAEAHTWRAALSNAPHLQGEVREREARACMVLNLQLTVIPGLLQTAEYARHLFTTRDATYSGESLAAAVAARLDRQLILYGDKKFSFLVGEAALRTRYGSLRTHLAQLDRIVSLSTLGNLSVGLLPHRHEPAVSTTHGFDIYEGVDERDSYVVLELIHGELFITDPADVRLYRSHWELLSRSALFDDQARAFLAEIGDSMRAEGV
ncbi:helix-turn-helix transcriptional regulator [Streptosporangium sp. NPDC048047]|uniref:helix-turn-helix domain-containing protein n=1 Tax=Streptosporangium sp. NPDC048047 TaxID=3155748 RepID=UPI00343CBF7B